MVTPERQTTRRVEYSSNNYIVVMVKILLVIVILFTLPSLVEGSARRRRNRQKKGQKAMVHRARLDCEVTCLGDIIYAEEAMNCVHECISTTCFREIYAIPLEPGEIDFDKAKMFQACAENEAMITRKKDRERNVEEQREKMK